MHTPRSVDLAITSHCNLRCNYCSHFGSSGDVGQDLPGKKWLQFFEELNRYAVMTVTLQGGEPFCRTDIRVLVEGIVSNRMRFHILTNGTLITDEMASFLSSTNRCEGIQVSIDGSVAETHDAFRGAGNFAKAMQGVEYLQEHNLPVSVRVTIHKENVHDLEAIARLLLEEYKLAGFSTNVASFMGLCRKNSQSVQLTAEERTLAMHTLLKLYHKYNGRISGNAGPLAEATIWQEMEQARRQRKKHLPGGGYLTGCGGPMETIAVRADGVIVPCIQMSHIALGIINKNDLKAIWQNHMKLTKLRNRFHIPLRDFKFCQGCSYINYCTGNCPALAYLIVGKEDHPSPDACLKRFLEQGGKLPHEIQW